MLIASCCKQVCYDGVAAGVPCSAGAVCSSSSQHPEPEHIRWGAFLIITWEMASASGMCTCHELAQPEHQPSAAGASSIAQHAALTALALGKGGGQPVQQMVAAFQVQQAAHDALFLTAGTSGSHPKRPKRAHMSWLIAAATQPSMGVHTLKTL